MTEIKISYLSIGDWVEIDGEPAKALCLRIAEGHIFKGVSGQMYRCCGGMDFEPIPLTPEILEKNGFVKEEDKDGNKRYSLIEGCTKFSLGYARSVFQWIFPIDVRYVHQLQHALRLAGVEKEIEV